jgi:hypothetical protein
MGIFNLKKLSEADGKEKYQDKISNRFAVLGNLDGDTDMKRAWDTTKGIIKILAKENQGYYELRHYNNGSTKEVKNNYTKDNKPNFKGNRTRAK